MWTQILGFEVVDRAEGAAVDCLAFDQGEPDRDQVHQDAWVEVKRQITRGFSVSQALTAACLSAT